MLTSYFTYSSKSKDVFAMVPIAERFIRFLSNSKKRNKEIVEIEYRIRQTGK